MVEEREKPNVWTSEKWGSGTSQETGEAGLQGERVQPQQVQPRDLQQHAQWPAV